MRRAALLTTCVLTLASFPVVLAPSAGAQSDEQSDAPTVELLDDGAQPRTELRLQLAAGTSTTAEISTTIKLTQRTGGRSRTVDTPEISIETTVKVASVATDGSATIDVEYGDSKVADDDSFSEEQLDQVRDSLDSIEGITGTFTVTPTGAASNADYQVPPDADATVRSMIEQLGGQTSRLTVPFPDEAVGEGARWRAKQEVELNGATINQTATYTLKSRTDDDITLGVQVRQRADDQVLSSAQGTADLVRHRGTGKGTTELDLTSAFPSSVDLDFVARQRLEAGGDRLDQTTKTVVEVRSQG